MRCRRSPKSAVWRHLYELSVCRSYRRQTHDSQSDYRAGGSPSGIDARNLKDSDVIPEIGVLDSAGIMELVIWFEMTFGVTIAQSDFTLENFGTVDAMASYLQQSK